MRGDKTVTVWGSGTPRREFLHVDDLADALYLLMQRYEEPQTINVGTGEDISIAHLADPMKNAIGYSGHIEFDSSKPGRDSTKALGHLPDRPDRMGMSSASGRSK